MFLKQYDYYHRENNISNFFLVKQPLQLHLSYNTIALLNSESTKYEGVVFYRKLTWKLYIGDMKQRAKK